MHLSVLFTRTSYISPLKYCQPVSHWSTTNRLCLFSTGRRMRCHRVSTGTQLWSTWLYYILCYQNGRHRMRWPEGRKNSSIVYCSKMSMQPNLAHPETNIRCFLSLLNYNCLLYFGHEGDGWGRVHIFFEDDIKQNLIETTQFSVLTSHLPTFECLTML